MTVRQTLDRLLENLPEQRLHELLDYARFLNWREESEPWQRFGRTEFSLAYGPDAPENSATDVNPELNHEELTGRETEFERQMEAEGWTEQIAPRNQTPPTDWHPLVMEGEPLSETIIRLRGERG